MKRDIGNEKVARGQWWETGAALPFVLLNELPATGR